MARPMATLEETLVPLYLHHRYAMEAAATAIGGQDYIYAFRGDGREPFTWATAAQQKAALDALMAHAQPSSARAAEVDPRQDSAAARTATADRASCSRATPAARSIAITPAIRRRRHDDRLHPDARSRRAHGGAEGHDEPALPGLEDVIDRLITAAVRRARPPTRIRRRSRADSSACSPDTS